MEYAQKPLPRRHRGEDNQPKPFLRLRNWLNIIFMIGAVVGVVVYYCGNQTLGTIIILAAMVFKIAEAAMRFLH